MGRECVEKRGWCELAERWGQAGKCLKAGGEVQGKGWKR